MIKNKSPQQKEITISPVFARAIAIECKIPENLIDIVINEKEIGKEKITEKEANAIMDFVVLQASYISLQQSNNEIKNILALQKNRNQITANINSRLMAEKRENNFVRKEEILIFFNFLKTSIETLKKEINNNISYPMNDDYKNFIEKSFTTMFGKLETYYKRKIESAESTSRSADYRKRNEK